jgi:enterochelin esterase-like enzyme
MFFGVMAVNRYYGYYETWGAVVGDITSQGADGVNAAPQVTGTDLPSASPVSLRGRSAINGGLARQQGYVLRLAVAGPRSRIARMAYVYLPPQYFQPAYQHYRFPVIELIHGQPGEPQDWINVVGVTVTLDRLVHEGLAWPVVLVMPDANGGEDISLQCLNQVRGPQDLTYLAQDVPAQITRTLRVQPPGPAWGVAGYSEGGFCAANMALRFRYRYGFAGVLSGYFQPSDNQLAQPIRAVNPFGTSLALRQQNTPVDELQQLPAGAVIPKFWLGAGRDDRQDVGNAEFFWQELALRQADVPLTLTAGGGHDMATWRAEVPQMLRWMTRGLARMARMDPMTRPAAVARPCGRPGPASRGHQVSRAAQAPLRAGRDCAGRLTRPRTRLAARLRWHGHGPSSGRARGTGAPAGRARLAGPRPGGEDGDERPGDHERPERDAMAQGGAPQRQQGCTVDGGQQEARRHPPSQHVPAGPGQQRAQAG